MKPSSRQQTMDAQRETPATDVYSAYLTAQGTARQQLRQIEQALTQHAAAVQERRLDWGHVGDLHAIIEILKTITQVFH